MKIMNASCFTFENMFKIVSIVIVLLPFVLPPEFN